MMPGAGVRCLLRQGERTGDGGRHWNANDGASTLGSMATTVKQ
jgi:hypothetical protein